MNIRKIDLRIAEVGRNSHVFIDGEELTNCRSINVTSSVDGISTVTLELVKVEVNVSGQADVVDEVIG